MNIYVCIKQVPDTETKIKLNGDQSGIDTAGIKWIMSPYDEFAVEEALRLREKNSGSTVTVVSAGPDRVTEAIRTALAMGADKGIHIEMADDADNFRAAKAIAEALKKESVDFVFTGKEAIDDGAAQTSQLIASMAGLPYATVVLEAEYGEGKVTVKREVEGGAIEVLEVQTPCLIAAHKGLNEPRYASLPNIMKAKKKEIQKVAEADLGVSESDQKIRMKNFELPPPKQAGRKLDGSTEEMVKELINALHNEAKVV